MFDGSGTPRKPEQRLEARRLRRYEGTPVRQIAATLSVSVSSVSYWVRDIQIQPEHERRNWALHQGSDAVVKRAERWSAICRERRATAQAEGRRKAQEGDPVHAAGCMLYWAEGSKGRNEVAFTNSDPAMLKVFIRFLRTEFGLGDDSFRVRINVYLGNGLPLEAIEDHWLNVLSLPRSCLRKGVVNHFPTSSSGRRKNKLPYGVCSLKVARSTAIVQHIFGAIQKYGGFEEPRWLG